MEEMYWAVGTLVSVSVHVLHSQRRSVEAIVQLATQGSQKAGKGHGTAEEVELLARCISISTAAVGDE